MASETGLSYQTSGCSSGTGCLTGARETMGDGAAYVEFTAVGYPGGTSCVAYLFSQTVNGAVHWLVNTAPCTHAPDFAPAVGLTVHVTTPGSCAHLRSSSGIRSPVLACLADRTAVRVTGPPQWFAPNLWWPVDSGGRAGWIAHDLLVGSANAFELPAGYEPPTFTAWALGNDPVDGTPIMINQANPSAGMNAEATWRWNGTIWVGKTAPPTYPSINLVYDATIHKLIMLTGGSTGAPVNTLAWDGARWVNLQTVTSPPSANGAWLQDAYDPVHHQLVLLDPTSQSMTTTWIFDGNDWSQSDTPSSPPSHNRGAMAFDPHTAAIVAYGGANDTWTWDGTKWTAHTPTGGPGGGNTVLAYDAAIQRLVMVEGPGDPASFGRPPTQHVSTWTWDGRTWSEVHASTAPPVGVSSGLVFDSRGQQLLLFQGDAMFPNWRTQTWGFAGGQWYRRA